MVENLKRIREPVGWTLVVVIVASMALSIVSLVRQVTGPQVREAVFAAFAQIASNSMNLTLVVSLVAVVCLCLFIPPPTPNAVALARAALVVVVLGTLLTLVATGLGVAASAGLAGIVLELLGGVLDLALKVAAVAVLWVIHRAVRAGRLAPEPEPAPAVEPPPAVAPDAPPVWQPNQAAGSVWATAAEAAAGSGPAALPPRAPVAPAAPAAPPVQPVQQPGPPVVREGAAEALGWRRVDRAVPEQEPNLAGEPRDTP